MSIHTLSRCGVVLCLVALTAGCSTLSSRTTSRLFNSCTWDREECLYEGSYEPGEEEYAEEEAGRLNKAQTGW